METAILLQWAAPVSRVIGTAPVSTWKAAVATAVHFALRRASSSTARYWQAIRRGVVAADGSTRGVDGAGLGQH